MLACLFARQPERLPGIVAGLGETMLDKRFVRQLANWRFGGCVRPDDGRNLTRIA